MGPILLSEFKALADEAVIIRDKIYAYTLTTSIGPLVERINRFLDDNAYLVFWGGALLFAVTQPTFFLIGFGIGMVSGAIVPPGPGEIDVSALRQAVKSVLYAVGPWMAATTQAVFCGLTPGYHSYRIFRAQHYPGLENFGALAKEFACLRNEVNQWLPARLSSPQVV